ncbi:hypothetical protein LINPERHAP1_LOCUS2021 [Linum perenne]
MVQVTKAVTHRTLAAATLFVPILEGSGMEEEARVGVRAQVGNSEVGLVECGPGEKELLLDLMNRPFLLGLDSNSNSLMESELGWMQKQAWVGKELGTSFKSNLPSSAPFLVNFCTDFEREKAHLSVSHAEFNESEKEVGVPLVVRNVEEGEVQSMVSEQEESDSDSSNSNFSESILDKGRFMSDVLDLQLQGSAALATERIEEVAREVLLHRSKSVPRSKKDLELRRLNWGFNVHDSGMSGMCR